jgi:hypothetical protein
MKPSLPGGSIHLLRIKDEGFEVSTMKDMFGNTESSTVFFLPYYEIIEILYEPSAMDVGHCRVVYLSKEKKRLSFKFHIIDQASLHGDRYAVKRLDAYTKKVAVALQRSMLGNRAQSPLPSKTIKPPGAMKKVIYGFAWLIGGMAIVGTGSLTDSTFLLFIGTFWICISLSAVIVDYVRVYTGWNPIIKLLVYIVTFIVVFIIFGTLMTIYEVYDLI